MKRPVVKKLFALLSVFAILLGLLLSYFPASASSERLVSYPCGVMWKTPTGTIASPFKEMGHWQAMEVTHVYTDPGLKKPVTDNAFQDTTPNMIYIVVADKNGFFRTNIYDPNLTKYIYVRQGTNNYGWVRESAGRWCK